MFFFSYDRLQSYHHFYCGKICINEDIIDEVNLVIKHFFIENNITVLDLNRVIAEIGIKDAYDTRNEHRWGIIYTSRVMYSLAEEIFRLYECNLGKTKKCVVLDCDGVLWKGILSEDGFQRIKIDRYHKEFQKFIQELFYHGIIVAICSKNDETDVLKVFQENKAMILKKNQIACWQVNWENKSENLKKIASDLNIGLDSIVFVDDSVFEINLVNTTLPQVKTILFDKTLIITQLSEYFNLSAHINLDNILCRQETYLTNVKRRVLQQNTDSFEEYLKSLDTQLEFISYEELNLDRISELSQRTNQCSNGKRYTVNELIAEKDKGAIVLGVRVTDKFSDLGISGAICIKRNCIELFCLSCRALGRNIENEILDYVVEYYSPKSYYFVSTGKNIWLEKNFQKKILIKKEV